MLVSVQYCVSYCRVLIIIYPESLGYLCHLFVSDNFSITLLTLTLTAFGFDD